MIQKFVHCQNAVTRTSIFEQTIETVVGAERNTIEEVVQLKSANATNAERRGILLVCVNLNSNLKRTIV